MSKLKLNWSGWFYGSVGAMIGGGSSAVVASLTAMGITPERYNLTTHLQETMKMFGACFLVNGLVSLFLWLKQRPVPEIEPDDEEEDKP